MRVLVPTRWLDGVSAELAARGVRAELVPYDRHHTGPFPGVEVFFRGEWAEAWTEALANAPDVRWLHTTSAGVDFIIPHTQPRGITLTESGEVYRIAIGEFVLALMLYGARRLGEFRDQTRDGVWRPHGGQELAGATVGVIGLGPIGLGAAERAAALGMRVIGLRRSGAPIELVRDVVGPDRLHHLLSESDYVVLAAPLTDETRGMIDARAFLLMKRTAWVINIARGGLIDTEALVEALRQRRIRGACLDVTEPEPLPEGHPLWGLPNVLITSHSASGDSPALAQRKVKLLVDNLQRYMAGQPLTGVVDYSRQY